MELREEILGMNDLKREDIDVPEWGETGKKLAVRELNGEERMQMYDACMEDGKFNAKLMPFVLATLSLIDRWTGERIFRLEDWTALKGKNGMVIERISDTAMRLSGLRALDTESAEKN
jgi:hypothetical protein